jgi:hypothetical protein
MQDLDRLSLLRALERRHDELLAELDALNGRIEAALATRGGAATGAANESCGAPRPRSN